MGTNARGHTIPDTGVQPSRTGIFSPLLTINDIVMVANATAQGIAIAAIAPTSARPLLIYRTDTDELYRANGTNVKLVASPALARIAAWTAYTPTLTAGTGSWSLGTTGAVNDCVWRYEGADLVRVRFRFILGTGFTFPTADPRFSLPVPAVTPAHDFAALEGVGSIRDTTVSGRQDIVHVLHAVASTTVVQLNAGTSPVGTPTITPTSPWTWAAGHVLAGGFTYRAA